MDEFINEELKEAENLMKKAIEHTQHEMSKIRAGKASPSLVEGIMVDYYGSPTPISQVASVNTPDARSITIKPWEKPMVAEIEKAIKKSDLGLTPINDGDMVRLNIPPLTEERRRELVKQVKAESENGKVSIRNVRKEANDSLRKLQKDGAAEDAIKRAETNVQELTDQYSKKIDELTEQREKDIMTV